MCFQLVITASHTDTHPPTDLHISDDGWATITTTSNFDVYLYDHLHPDADAVLGDMCPTPLVTLSARLEEAFILGDDVKAAERSRPISPPVGQRTDCAAGSNTLWTVLSSLSGGSGKDMPHLLYRRMSIVCFDPYDPNTYSGGVDSSAPNICPAVAQGQHSYAEGPYAPPSQTGLYSETDGYVHLHSQDGFPPPGPVQLTRSKTDPGTGSGALAPGNPEGGMLGQDCTTEVVGTGLRKRGLVSVSIKSFADTVDISTGGGAGGVDSRVACEGGHSLGGSVSASVLHDQQTGARSYALDDTYTSLGHRHLVDSE